MNRKSRILILVSLIVLVIFSTAFIFMNSLMDYEHSHGPSGAITDIVNPTDDVKERDQTELIIRKLAHIIEYAVLGACASALCVFIDRVYRRRLYGYFIAYSFFIAVLDEHFQGFSDRVSSTSDILLDFLGSIFGFSIVLLVFFIALYFNSKKHKRKSAQP